MYSVRSLKGLVFDLERLFSDNKWWASAVKYWRFPSLKTLPFSCEKKRVELYMFFRKDSKLPFWCNNASTEFFAHQKPSKEMEDENSNANPVRLLFKRWRFHPTKSIHVLPTAVQLQCNWSTSISMHKSCTCFYLLGDSPIQKNISDAACQVSASNIWVTWCPASPNRNSPCSIAIDECLEYFTEKNKRSGKKTQIFHCKPQKKTWRCLCYV